MPVTLSVPSLAWLLLTVGTDFGFHVDVGDLPSGRSAVFEHVRVYIEVLPVFLPTFLKKSEQRIPLQCVCWDTGFHAST